MSRTDASSWVVEVGEADFEREVLKRSAQVPVVVDFWAPWCGPCRALAPLLERLVDEHRGAFVLAKVNVDEAPALAQAFGVRSIPAVQGFRDGRLVTEFVGAQPEPVVRRLIETVLPTAADRRAREAEDLAAAGDTEGAESGYRDALAEDARHSRALVGLAKLLGERGETEEALRLLQRVGPGTPVSAEADRLAAAFRTHAPVEDGDEAALRARVSQAPDDLEARLALGRALAARGAYEEALAELLEVVRRDPRFADEEARRAMLDLFELLGPDDPLTQRYRAALARALFR